MFAFRFLPPALLACLLTLPTLAQTPGAPGAFAVVYTGADFTGWSYRILPGDEIAAFELLQDGRWAFLDRAIHSIELHGPIHLEVFERSDFRGEAVFLGASIADLRNYEPPYAHPRRAAEEDGDWSERIASLRAHAGPLPVSAIEGPKHYGGTGVIFYVDTHFGGSSFGYDAPAEERRLGRANIGHLDWNDRISSIEINGPFRVTLYKNGNLTGASVTLTASNEDLGAVRNAFGRFESWNDDISSFRLEWLQPPPPPTGPPPKPSPAAVATLFVSPDFQGRAIELVEGQEIARLGALDWGDKISSLRITPGYAVVLYEKGHYQGRSIRVTADQRDLKDQRFNDRASSLRVEKQP